MNLDGAGDRPRLTDAQKKQNHIESEKKRREAIRAGFERLAKIIPECAGQARSEAVVLQRTVAYLRELLQKKEELRQRAFEQGYSQADFEQMFVAGSFALFTTAAANDICAAIAMRRRRPTRRTNECQTIVAHHE